MRARACACICGGGGGGGVESRFCAEKMILKNITFVDEGLWGGVVFSFFLSFLLPPPPPRSPFYCSSSFSFYLSLLSFFLFVNHVWLAPYFQPTVSLSIRVSRSVVVFHV